LVFLPCASAGASVRGGVSQSCFDLPKRCACLFFLIQSTKRSVLLRCSWQYSKDKICQNGQIIAKDPGFEHKQYALMPVECCFVILFEALRTTSIPINSLCFFLAAMQNLTMASAVVIRRILTGDVMKDTMTSIIKWVEYSEEYLCQRFGLHLGQISKICRDDSGFSSPSSPMVPFTFNNFGKGWSQWWGSSYTLVAKGDLEDCQPPCLSVEKGKSLLDVTHILDDLDGLDNKDNVKVLNLVPSSSDTSDFPLSAEVNGGQINLNEEECFENPSNDNIHEQLNEPQGIASELNGNQKIKVYQISVL
jgi:hypothetical protein